VGERGNPPPSRLPCTEQAPVMMSHHTAGIENAVGASANARFADSQH
jgi:hypothetical protein